MKVLVVDDHAVVREGVSRILSDLPEVKSVDQAGGGHVALRMTRERRYDVIILDISMPGYDGLDLLKQLKAERSESNVIVFSVFPEDQFATRTLKAGAAAYLTKDRTTTELIDAVRKVSAGKKYVTSSLAELLAEDFARGGSKEIYTLLTDRELQVLLAIASGKTVSQVGKQLGLSVKTISTYRTRLLEKTGLKTTGDLIRFAIEKRLMSSSFYPDHDTASNIDENKP
jgi:two-component system, NarL family, invasion response regulator UvrY